MSEKSTTALSVPEATGFPVTVPPWAMDLVGQLKPAMDAAQLIIAAGMAPKGYERPQQIIVACAMGARLGLDPFSAMAGISVINGRPTVWGDTMLAVCQNHAAWGGMKVERTGDGDAFKVSVTVNRKGTDPATAEFSMADAKRAGLAGKQGPWSQYPKRMVELRARAFALRQAFADALAGFHAREELDDGDLVDVTATATVHQEPRPAKRRTITTEPTPGGQEAAPIQSATAQAPSQPAPTDTPAAVEQTTAPVPSDAPAAGAEQEPRTIADVLTLCGQAQERHGQKIAIDMARGLAIAYGVKTVKEIPEDKADEAFRTLAGSLAALEGGAK